MKNKLIIKRAVLRKALNVLGVCTIGLIAACAKYGVEVANYNLTLKGKVKSQDSLNPIENIQVSSIYPTHPDVLTDENGEFTMDVMIEEGSYPRLSIEDIDGELHGSFMSKDTSFAVTSEEQQSGLKSNIEIQLDRDE